MYNMKRCRQGKHCTWEAAVVAAARERRLVLRPARACPRAIVLGEIYCTGVQA
jgi:hypothetical protein